MSGLTDLPRLPFRQWFPWLVLFRAGGLAVGWPQLGIAFVSVAVYGTGSGLLSRWFPDRVDSVHLPRLIKSDAAFVAPLVNNSLATLAQPWRQVAMTVSRLVWDPSPAFQDDFVGSNLSATVFDLIWAIAVWSLFGTAICRAVAVEVAKDRSESFPLALRYARSRWWSAIGAPSIPAGAIAALGIGLSISGFLGRTPLLGTPLLLALSPLLLLAGIGMAFLALVIVIGWPLMIAALGVEDCDSFGALSRTYSFVAGRPFHAAWNVAVSAIYGGVVVALAGGLLTLSLAALDNVLEGPLGTVERWQTVMNWSRFFARWLFMTFAVSLFWSLIVMNYLLLRQEVDRKPFDDIAPGPDEVTIRRDLPVVGIHAADLSPEQRERLVDTSDAELTTS